MKGDKTGHRQFRINGQDPNGGKAIQRILPKPLMVRLEYVGRVDRDANVFVLWSI